MKSLSVHVRRLAIIGLLVGVGCGSGADPVASQARFVAVGASGTIVSSLDGSMWTAESTGVSADLTSVAAGPSGFVAVGAGGVILSSPDGVAWTKRTSQTSADLSHVIFNGEKFVAVGGSWESGAVTVKSSDGVTWTAVESPADYMFHAVAHGDGTLVVAAYSRSDLQTPALFASAISSGSLDAQGWSQSQGPDFYDSLDAGAAIGIMVVGETAVATSLDGTAWTVQQLPSSKLVTGVASDGSTFVIVGELGAIYASAAGACAASLCWSERANSLGTSWLSGVTHGDSMFVAVGQSGAIVTSSDSWTWTNQLSQTSKHLLDVAYGPSSI